MIMRPPQQGHGGRWVGRNAGGADMVRALRGVLHRRRRCDDPLSGARDIGLAGGAGEQPVMANAMGPLGRIWSDLQNDPADIPLMLAKLAEGYRRRVRLAQLPAGCRNFSQFRESGCKSRDFADFGRSIARLRLHAEGLSHAKCWKACGCMEKCTASCRFTPPGWGRGSSKFRCVITRAERANRNTGLDALSRSFSI